VIGALGRLSREIALPPRSRTYDNAPAKRLIARCGHLARRSTRQGALIEVSVAAVVEPPIATAVEPEPVVVGRPTLGTGRLTARTGRSTA
jgi:hypothetical protein